MPYRITARIAGITSTTLTFETAAQALVEVQGLLASDEKVRIVDPVGRMIGRQELRDLAAKEEN
jgi:hypothetical protein